MSVHRDTTKATVSSLFALLYTSVKQADRHGLPEIRISTARARQLLHDLIVAKKYLEGPVQKPHTHTHIHTHER